MTDIFTRIKESVAADMHEVLDKKEKKNPMALLNQYLRESEKETENVRELIERQYKLKEEFVREYEEARAMADKRSHQATVAENAGEMEMMEFALMEKEAYTNRAERLLQSKQEADGQLQELERNYEEMKHKLKDMHVKRMELMGRENIAKAHHRIARVSEDAADKPYTRFSELDRHMEQLEQRIHHSYQQSTFDSEMAKLEKRQ
ncbi:PspA/IM30 family protein [Salimicrobium sp. PL1-032A]|uniref:PspA/IM30 family protein n=1 Tax=Salimicrobium sp. PL1-032A TaxID=3095364 RepID=UPI0032601497